MSKKPPIELQVVSGETGHKYFHQMLNMADDDLNPHEYRLLGHYLRWAGHGGTHEEGIRQTAKVCRMGQAALRKARKELVDKGYLIVHEPTKEQAKEGIPTKIFVVDRWGENVSRYTPVSKQIQGSAETCIQTDTPPVSEQLHSEELSLEKRKIEEQKDSLPNGKGASEQSIKPKRKAPAQPKHSKAELDTYYDAIATAWNTDAGGWIGSMRKMFMGEATRGTWKECNFNPPATADEITAFAEWWGYKKLSMPTEAVKIQKHFYDYRKERAKPEHPSFRRVTQEELDSGAYQDVAPEDLPEDIQAALNKWMELRAG